METIVKDEKGKVTEYFVNNKLITFRKEKATDKNGKEVEVDVVNESMDARIDMLPTEFTQPIIEKMVTAHKANVDGYSKSGNTELLKKEQYELEVLEGFLPKEATKEDVMEYLNEYYPSGIERKSMGLVIKEVKSAFERGFEVIIPEGTNSTFDNDYMTGETTVRYYNEDVWEELVDSVTIEEAIDIMSK
jgi:uncharacterized protein YqeY